LITAETSATEHYFGMVRRMAQPQAGATNTQIIWFCLVLIIETGELTGRAIRRVSTIQIYIIKQKCLLFESLLSPRGVE
jgi:hypothetical protein